MILSIEGAHNEPSDKDSRWSPRLNRIPRSIIDATNYLQIYIAYNIIRIKILKNSEELEELVERLASNVYQYGNHHLYQVLQYIRENCQHLTQVPSSTIMTIRNNLQNGRRERMITNTPNNENSNSETDWISTDVSSPNSQDSGIVLECEESPLHEASREGDLIRLQELIAEGADIDDDENVNFETPLHCAVKYEQSAIVQVLLENNADYDAQDIRDETPLHLATKLQNQEMMTQLIDAGADINSRNIEKQTCLHQAVQLRNMAVLMLLLSNGADANFIDNHHNTALHVAMQQDGDIAIANALIDAKGAKLGIQNLDGFTPLHLAVEYNQADIVEKLLSHGVDVNARTKNGRTCLHLAAQFGRVHLVPRLLEAGVDPARQDKKMCTALEYAVQNGCQEIISLLMQHCPNKDVIALLHLAIKYGHFKVVQSLLDLHGGVNDVDEYHMTALHHASRYGRRDIAVHLIAREASVHAEDHSGHTPLDWAVSESHLQMVNILIKNGARVNGMDKFGENVLHFAARQGDCAILDALIKNGANTEVRNRDGETPLHCAVIHKRLEIVRRLIAANADLNARNRDQKTALHYASERGFGEIARCLIQAWKSPEVIDAEDYKGNTPLHYAVRAHDEKLVKVFVDGGANVSYRNGESKTSLHFVAIRGHLGITRQLLQAGSNMYIKCVDEKIPLLHALERRHVLVVQEIISHIIPWR